MFNVHTTQIVIRTAAPDSDQAVRQVLEFENAPFEAFLAVYQENPVPAVSGKYGAPMGRCSATLDHDGTWRARRIPLDGEGYDAGGAYWGLRQIGQSLFAVQDGMGNIAFVDAAGPQGALAIARA